MSAAKAKGTAWETLIVRAIGRFVGAVVDGPFSLRRPGRFGIFPRRVLQEGFEDVGDVHGVSPFVIQAKAYKSLTDALRIGLPAAVLQAKRAGEDYGVLIMKKPRGRVGDAYAVMRLEDWTRVLLRIRRAEWHLAQANPVNHPHDLETWSDLDAPFPVASELGSEAA